MIDESLKQIEDDRYIYTTKRGVFKGDMALNQPDSSLLNIDSASIEKKNEELILYWAKTVEHKSLSLHELVQNVKWLFTKLK